MLSTIGRRSSSYAASAAGTSAGPRPRNAQANATASSIASFVPEPIEKWAVWAASPTSTTLSELQWRLRTVVKLIHLELLAISSWPSSASANSSRQNSIERRSEAPGGSGPEAI